MGKEGRQAVRCSDFGFAKFRFLKKMLLVHGHWNYVRVAVFVQFSFYKNVAFNTPIVFYSIWNAFSTQVFWSFVKMDVWVTCSDECVRTNVFVQMLCNIEKKLSVLCLGIMAII